MGLDRRTVKAKVELYLEEEGRMSMPEGAGRADQS
jgi:hypothetical protein